MLQYIKFYSGKTHPNDMGKNEVERFLSFLAEKKKVAAATQKQAFNALRPSQLPEEAGFFSKYSIASPTR
ncbi:MAG: hypothetical protein DRH21_04040 [Deltaproteobacteria bacterium]|nr:MAG: hypothetical protein DRH21_04040 [Deltaproteobacteria bacterium]